MLTSHSAPIVTLSKEASSKRGHYGAEQKLGWQQTRFLEGSLYTKLTQTCRSCVLTAGCHVASDALSDSYRRDSVIASLSGFGVAALSSVSKCVKVCSVISLKARNAREALDALVSSREIVALPQQLLRFKVDPRYQYQATMQLMVSFLGFFWDKLFSSEGCMGVLASSQ